MPWLQLRARAGKECAEELEHALEELGALSVTLQDAEDEAVFQLDRDSTPLWRQVELVGLFPADTEPEALSRALRSACPDCSPVLKTETLEDRDWERSWMTDFRPMRFGEQVWVCPSWSEPPAPDAVNLFLDPGLAFGSGTHPTTALCLEWLDAHPPRDRNVIDYGCGSGILAVASALLGARRVVAVDNDPQAVTACAGNRDLNGIDAGRLSTHLPDADERHAPGDVVLANILAGPLESLAPVLTRLTAPGGTLVLSGILSGQSETLQQTYASGFIMEPPVIREGWALLQGVRRPQ